MLSIALRSLSTPWLLARGGVAGRIRDDGTAFGFPSTHTRTLTLAASREQIVVAAQRHPAGSQAEDFRVREGIEIEHPPPAGDELDCLEIGGDRTMSHIAPF